MTEKELLELLSSWDNLPVLEHELGSNTEHFSVLMKIALESNDPVSWRAAYMVDKIQETHPQLLIPYIDRIIEQLKTEKHHGKKRHFLRQLSFSPLKEKHFGFLVDFCLSTLTSAKEAVAIRVHAMQILYNISEQFQDLKPELLAILEHEMEFHSTPGIKSRGGKLAVKLRKQIDNLV